MTATRSIADLPGPRGLPLIGNAHRLRLATLPRTIDQWCEPYGPIFRVDIGPRRLVAIDDLDEINRILRDRPDGFARWRDIREVIAEMGSPGVFAEEGEVWRRQRRLVVTALNTNHLHRYFEVIHTATARLHRRLLDAARAQRSLQIGHELMSFTVDVTSALAFGHDLNTLERGENELQRHIQTVFEMTARRMFTPVRYWRLVKLPADRALNRSLAELRRAIETFIEQARARMQSSPGLYAAPENFLEGMLAAQREERAFTDDEIVANTQTLLFAGEDTTAHTIAWTIWLLAQHPDVQTRLADEADAVLREHVFPADHETVAELRYAEAVLRESMRLKPVAGSLAVEPLADTVILDTRIPAGTRLWLTTRHACLGAVERGHELDPERWLGDDAAATPDQKAFLTFGAGPRFCPGRNLAFLESKSALAMIARNFEIELDTSQGEVSEVFSFTTMPHGLRVRLRERVVEPPMAVSAGQPASEAEGGR